MQNWNEIKINKKLWKIAFAFSGLTVRVVSRSYMGNIIQK